MAAHRKRRGQRGIAHCRPHPAVPSKKQRGTQKEPVVRIDNELSNNFTVLEIEAQDRFGLLFRIARSLSSPGSQHSLGKALHTVDRAVDTFYVTGGSGSKIVDKEQIERLERELIGATSRD